MIHEIAGHLAILRKAAELTEAPPPAQPDEPVQARAEKAPAREGIFRRSVKALGQFSRRVIGQERAAQAPEIVEPESGLLPPGQVGPLDLPLPLVPKPVLPEHGQGGPQRGARSKKIREQAAPTIRRAPEEKTGKPLPPSRPKRKGRIPLQEGTEPVPGFVSEAAYRGDNAPDEIRPFEVPVADIGSMNEAESAAPENGDALELPPDDSSQSLPSPWDDQG